MVRILPFVYFAYKNWYLESFKMIPFEALYGRRCNTPMSWDNTIYIPIIGTDLIKEIEEHMVKIKPNLKDT